MPANNVTYYAVFSVGSFSVTFYQYEASEHGPSGTPAPGYEQYSTATYAYGAEIVFPATPEIDNYTFTGWFDAEGNKYEAGATAPANNLELYPQYERIAVKLVPKAGSNFVIERDGKVEKHADNSVTSVPVAPNTAGDYDEFYVYGLPARVRGEATLNAGLEVLGDGRIEYDTTLTSGGYGTGCKVIVYDNITGEVAEQFYIVIFGDLNGDTRINTIDTGLHSDEVISPTWSNRRNPVPYMVKAADLNGDKRVNTIDTGLHSDVCIGNGAIDQTTGEIY